jgi:hypothetical protein
MTTLLLDFINQADVEIFDKEGNEAHDGDVANVQFDVFSTVMTATRVKRYFWGR